MPVHHAESTSTPPLGLRSGAQLNASSALLVAVAAGAANNLANNN
jgi:hypothetical protein